MSQNCPHCGCNDAVAVADKHADGAGFVERFGIFLGKARQLADGRIFLKNNLTVVSGKYFKRIAVANAQASSDRFREE